MIPLAQYLSDFKDDEFVPPRALERRIETTFAREGAPSTPTPAAPMLVRPLRPVPVREARPAADIRLPAPARGVPLADIEAERSAFAAERARLEGEANAERERALAALREELAALEETRVEALRAELAATHADAVRAERERWTSEQADRLADLTILQMAVFEDSMRATVKAVLKPLALDARQRRAIDDLAEAVRMIAPEGTEFKIAATGPSDLLAKFRDKLGDRAAKLSVRPDESRVDIRVEADQTAIETRLSVWGQALEKALS